MSLDEEIIKQDNAKIASFAKSIDAWVTMFENEPEMKNTVISQMKSMSDKFKKSAGVIEKS